MGKDYYLPLTWLRGIAAFFVVIAHVQLTLNARYFVGDQPIYSRWLAPFDLGTFAVYLFFALSGCTLYLSNHATVSRGRDLLPFYIKRLFRIWPVFAISLVVYLLFIELFRMGYSGDQNLWIAQFLRPYSIADIPAYLSLSFNFSGPSGLFIGPYWSLPVEFQYYLLLAPILWAMKRLGTWGVLMPLAMAAALLLLSKPAAHWMDRNEMPMMAYTFFIGVTIGWGLKRTEWRLRWEIAAVVLFLLFVVANLLRHDVLVVPKSIPLFDNKRHCYGVVACIAVACAALMAPPASAHRLALLRRYGEISYSIYLVHMLFLGLATLALCYWQPTSLATKVIVVTSFALLGSFWLASLSYEWVEKPAIKLGRQLSNGRSPSSSVTAQPVMADAQSRVG